MTPSRHVARALMRASPVRFASAVGAGLGSGHCSDGCTGTVRRPHRSSSYCPSSNNNNNNNCRRRSFSTAVEADDPSSSEIHPERSYPRLSVAIVGAGPSGFYAAKYLTSSVLKRVKSANSPNPFKWTGIDVDIIERLPTPYGLVRYGVAPDHPEVKNAENDFASLFQKEDIAGDNDKNAPGEDPPSTISYFGNVDVGKDIPLSHLQSLYHVVILAYGCQADRRLGIPGEDALDGVLSAREFVAWYNGHPEFGHIGPIVERCLCSSRGGEESSDAEGKVSPARVVVIGQGNVALDVARVLAKGKPGLVDTDTPNSVLQVLQGGAACVSVVGRRGHVQGAFTIKELRELVKLKKEGHDATFIVRKEELDLGMTQSSVAELKGAAGRPKTRINKLLQDSALMESNTSDSAKQVELRFLMNPVSMEPNVSNSDRVGSVVCERTKLEGEPFQQRPVGTNETEAFPADLVLVSIGYRGMPLPGMEGLQLFDNQNGVVANDHGKVLGENNLFVTGWIKRGPTGIIGTNIFDAKDTVGSVMKYIDSGNNQLPKILTVDGSNTMKGRVGLTQHLHACDVKTINWKHFMKIEAAEADRSKLRSDVQPREKLLSVKEMLDVAS